MPTIPVAFSGGSRGPGPLTWGQRLLWTDHDWLGEDDGYYNLPYTVEVPDGRRAQDVQAALAVLMSRCEVLRSHFRPGPDGEPEQLVAPTGTADLELVEAGAEAADLRPVVRREFHRLRAARFRCDRELPVRFCLVTADGVARMLIIVFSHLAVDGDGARMLIRRFSAILAGEPGAAGFPVAQPLDRAAFERSPAGRKTSRRALDLLRRSLLEVPRTMLPMAARTPDAPRYRRMEMRSPALTAASRCLSHHLGVSTSAVLRAGIAAVLGVAGGNSRVVLKLILGNRGFPDLRELAGVAVSNGYLALDVASGTFAELVAACASRSLLVQARSQCDPLERERLIAEVAERRGIELDLSAFFNDMRDGGVTAPDDAPEVAPRTLLDRTRLRPFGEWERQDTTFFFHVTAGDDCDPVYLLVDTAYIPGHRLPQLLRGLERLLVAATEGPVPLRGLEATTGISAPVRGPRWRLIDHCWADLDEVTALVREAQPDAESYVATEPGPDGDQLVAYLAGPGRHTPADVHRAVMAGIAARPATVAPGRYVLVTSAPDRRDDHDGWSSRPVRLAGSGRAGAEEHSTAIAHAD